MKFSAQRENLLKPLQAVAGVVERRQTMPILSNVLLIARDGQLSVTATDLEVEHRVAETHADGLLQPVGRVLRNDLADTGAGGHVDVLTFDLQCNRLRHVSTMPAFERDGKQGIE